MTRQTAVQEGRSIRFGSGRFEIYDGDTSSWIDLGAMREIQFEELWERVRVMSYNAGPVSVGIREHRAALQGNLMEINLKNLALIRGGLDVYTENPGIKEEGVEQVITAGNWEFDKFIKIENQNHDLAEIDIDSVVGSGTPYVADTDYLKVQDAAGNWGIIVLDSTTPDLGDHITIKYDYTPAESKTLESGGKITINPRAVRVTNYDEDGKMFRIEVFKAEVENGINIELQSDDAEDPAITEIRLEGDVDQAKDPGKQLFKITDTQNV